MIKKILTSFYILPLCFLSLLISGTLSFSSPVYGIPPASGDLNFSGSTSSCNPTCGGNISWTTSSSPISVTIDQIVNGNASNIYTGTDSSGNAPVIISQGDNVFKLNVNGGDNEDELTVSGVAATPTPNPIAKSCDQDCSGGQACVSGLSCINNRCRLPSYPNESNCQAPSYPEYRSCNQTCGGGNQQCVSGLSCLNNLCRLPSNQGDTNCNAPAGVSSSPPAGGPTPTPTPKKTTTKAIGGSTSGQVFGTTTTPTPTPLTHVKNESTNSSDMSSDEITPTEIPTPTKIPSSKSSGSISPTALAIGGILVLATLVTIGYLTFFRKNKYL